MIYVQSMFFGIKDVLLKFPNVNLKKNVYKNVLLKLTKNSFNWIGFLFHFYVCIFFACLSCWAVKLTFTTNSKIITLLKTKSNSKITKKIYKINFTKVLNSIILIDNFHLISFRIPY